MASKAEADQETNGAQGEGRQHTNTRMDNSEEATRKCESEDRSQRRGGFAAPGLTPGCRDRAAEGSGRGRQGNVR